MADTTPKETKISLKMMVHKAENRVIYTEADSSFVDILFSFMTLPLATIVRILEKCPDQKVQALGSLKNLYQSLTDIPTSYMSAGESKDMLLGPISSSYYDCRKLKINIDHTDPPKFFTCPVHYEITDLYFSNYNTARCHCGNMMTHDLKIGHPAIQTDGDDGVFVSDVTTFIVTEDLRVLPNASGVSIKLLCDSGILDASQIQERSYEFGIEQILRFFKGALSFKYPLTYLVFPSTHIALEHFNLRQSTLIQHVKEITTASKKMMLKITLQKSTSRFLFAEAEGDFVDFVFGFLQIPLGTVIGKLMNGSTSIDNMDNLFASISEMKVEKYIKSQDIKEKLLQPQLVHSYISQNNIFSLEVPNTPQYSDAACKYLNLKDPRVRGGFVKAAVKFMLTDDLVITPLSTFSTIALLNKQKVPLNDVVEHELSIGLEEGLKILKALFDFFIEVLITLNRCFTEVK